MLQCGQTVIFEVHSVACFAESWVMGLQGLICVLLCGQEVEYIQRHADGQDGPGIFLASSQRVYIRVHPSRFMGYHPSELDSTPV